jgi:hypothetical protein
MSGNFGPQMTHYHLLYRSRKNYILLNHDTGQYRHENPSDFLFALVRLFSIFVQERKYPFLGGQK